MTNCKLCKTVFNGARASISEAHTLWVLKWKDIFAGIDYYIHFFFLKIVFSNIRLR